jgi:hypothetical protein
VFGRSNLSAFFIRRHFLLFFRQKTNIFPH